MTTIYLVRHAEAEGNLFRRAQGQYNGMITALGRRQIERLRERFLSIPVEAVYASDLLRTRLTAGAIYETKGLPLQLDPRLREYGLGCWENVPWSEWEAQDPKSLLAFNTLDNFSPAGGETPAQVRERVSAAFRDIVSANEGRTVAIVSHGMALRILMGTLEGLDFDDMRTAPHSDNTAVSCVEVDGDSVRLVFRDDNSHLGELSTFAKQSWWRNKGNAPDAALRFFTPDLTADGDELLTVFRAAADELGREFSPQDCLARCRALQERGGTLRLARWLGETAGIVIPSQQGCWFYLLPALRGKRLGIQLVGEAISALRGCGERSITCVCETEELASWLVYYGFNRSDLRCTLDIDISL